MTAIELARLVNHMRFAQNSYFKHRTKDWLVESKRLERMVDQSVQEIVMAGVNTDDERYQDEETAADTPGR